MNYRVVEIDAADSTAASVVACVLLLALTPAVFWSGILRFVLAICLLLKVAFTFKHHLPHVKTPLEA